MLEYCLQCNLYLVTLLIRVGEYGDEYGDEYGGHGDEYRGNIANMDMNMTNIENMAKVDGVEYGKHGKEGNHKGDASIQVKN